MQTGTISDQSTDEEHLIINRQNMGPSHAAALAAFNQQADGARAKLAAPGDIMLENRNDRSCSLAERSGYIRAASAVATR